MAYFQSSFNILMRPYLSFLILLLLAGCNQPLDFTSAEPIIPKEETSSVQSSDIKVNAKERACSNHIRGLQLLNDMQGWASGAGGTVLRMTDGEHWEVFEVPGYSHLDFRDIHGFDEMTALAMAAGEEGRIIHTEDGGQTWTEVYTNLEDGIFLDGIDFDGDIGYCIGDPMDGKALILRSIDAGRSWSPVDPETIATAIPREGSYAASGTTVVSKEGMTYAAYGGDSLIRVLKNKGELQGWTSIQAPLRIGEGCGIFSLAFKNEQEGVAVGGCYIDSLSSEGNCAVISDAGETWTPIKRSTPSGYRSCVVYAPSSDFYLTCGRTGIDFSNDNGLAWDPVSTDGYYTCSLADSTGWLMGRNGRMAKVKW